MIEGLSRLRIVWLFTSTLPLGSAYGLPFPQLPHGRLLKHSQVFYLRGRPLSPVHHGQHFLGDCALRGVLTFWPSPVQPVSCTTFAPDPRIAFCLTLQMIFSQSDTLGVIAVLTRYFFPQPLLGVSRESFASRRPHALPTFCFPKGSFCPSYLAQLPPLPPSNSFLSPGGILLSGGSTAYMFFP